MDRASVDVALLSSITDASAGDVGKVGVSGSHGGTYAAAVASRAQLRAVVLNDAGRGLDDAGVAGLRALDAVGMCAAAVSAMSARIGDAEDALENGVVSFANVAALELGVRVGARLKEQMHLFATAAAPHALLPAVPEARWQERIDGLEVLCVDSASLINAGDADRIIITGSHGGLIGGDPARACKAQAMLVAFNDAGGGKDDVGFTRLPALNQRGVAALTLDCQSCRIGDAASALAGGVISRANDAALRLGLQPGLPLREAIANIADIAHGAKGEELE